MSRLFGHSKYDNYAFNCFKYVSFLDLMWKKTALQLIYWTKLVVSNNNIHPASDR